MHFRFLVMMLKERVWEGKHRKKVWWHVTFYAKGILRGLGIMKVADD
jgi:hypothetical protein